MAKGKVNKPLMDKVALIIDGLDGDGKALAFSLADYGADIALVCLPENEKKALRIKEQVQNLDRRCFVIVENEDVNGEETDIITRVLDHFGHLDFFINYSSAWPVNKNLLKRKATMNDSDQAQASQLSFNILANILKNLNQFRSSSNSQTA